MIKPEQQLNNRLFINIYCLPFKHTPIWIHTRTPSLSVPSVFFSFISPMCTLYSIRLLRFVFNLTFFRHLPFLCRSLWLPLSLPLCLALLVCVFVRVFIFSGTYQNKKHTERTICLFVCSNVVDGRGHTIHIRSTLLMRWNEKKGGEKENHRNWREKEAESR